MKVCIIGNSFDFFSGTTKPLLILANELQKTGVEVTILSNVNLESNHEINDFFQKSYKINIIYIEKMFQKIIQKRDNYLKKIFLSHDIIHGVDFISLFFIKKFLTYHNINKPLIYSLTGEYKLELSNIISSGLPFLLNFTKISFIIKLFIPRFVIFYIFKKFDKIISSSKYIETKIISQGFPPDKIITINVGFDLDSNIVSDITSKKFFEYDFLYYGWGSSIRGLPDLISAFERLLEKRPDAKLGLFLLGSHGFEENYYCRLITKKSYYNKSIELNIGPNLNVIEKVKKSRAIVLPFRSTFGYSHPPLTILESMWAGRPVITTNIGSIPELISNGNTGFLVPSRNSNELERKMILVFNETLVESIVERARAMIINNFSINKNVSSVKKLYSDIIKGDTN